MTASRIGKQIDNLIMAERWDEARALIEKALKKEPDSHWLLTQLGETYYEQRDYKKALGFLLRSRDIVPDCPLTLWHLAGTLDALGYRGGAVRLYTWLLQSKKTPEDDPCWENVEWTDSLKTDCVYRLGLCFKHSGQTKLADFCLRRYITLQSMGPEAKGSYSVKEAKKHLEALHHSERGAVEQELQETAERVRQTSGKETSPTEDPPELDSKSLQQLQEA
ncbi:MAG: tetratricopeptide repeat protein [Planctomycetes bacterium]|nr:tetratricopeptide repeat protein [Planctomycetota bacterium]